MSTRGGRRSKLGKIWSNFSMPTYLKYKCLFCLMMINILKLCLIAWKFCMHSCFHKLTLKAAKTSHSVHCCSKGSTWTFFRFFPCLLDSILGIIFCCTSTHNSGMFSVKFQDPMIYPVIFSMILFLETLACASLKNYRKKHVKFPRIPKIWC